MISSHSRKQEVFQALELGALDFIAKPDRFFSTEVATLRRELIAKAMAVRALQPLPFSKAGKARESSATLPVEPATGPGEEKPVQRVVCIGSSTGGPPALQSLFSALGAGGPTAFLVAQHMPEKFTRAFAERLDRRTTLTIKEAEEGDLIKPGHVYIAPGGGHLELGGQTDQRIARVRAVKEDDHYIPSVDRLFASVAENFDKRMLAVVLTGMGSDGAEGVRAIRDAGGHVLVESRETAIVYGMPKEAARTGCVSQELPLGGLIEAVHRFALVGIEPTSAT